MNGKPIISDLELFRAIQNRGDKDIYAMLPHLPWKSLYAHLNKDRFVRWIECGSSMNYPWLTPAGIARLAELEAEEMQKTR